MNIRTDKGLITVVGACLWGYCSYLLTMQVCDPINSQGTLNYPAQV